MSARVTVTLDVAQGTNPFAVNTTRSPRRKIRLFIALLRALIGGGVFSRGTTHPTLKVGTAAAAGTVTWSGGATGATAVINGVTFTGGQYAARVRATLVSSVAGDTITVNGVLFTGTAGAVVLGAGTYSVDTSDTAAATSLAAQINAHPTLIGVVSASSAAGVVTMKAVTEGTAGNALTITKVGAPITLTAQGGGADTGVFQNGAAAGTNTFDSIASGGSDTKVAASLAASINRSATAFVAGVVTSTSATAVTTITAVAGGLGGNTYTLTAAGTGPTASGAKLTGGTQSTFSF